MSELLDSITGSMVIKALDASLLTHNTIANNIANAQTEGYRPLTVNFDQLMGEVKATVDSGGSFQEVKSALDKVQLRADIDIAAQAVLLDQQMVEMAKNTTHYQALLAAREQLGSLVSTAIKGGQN